MHIKTRTAPQPFVLSLSKDETDFNPCMTNFNEASDAH
jgi:hypothetical protein